jgi:hypothetical protein
MQLAHSPVSSHFNSYVPMSSNLLSNISIHSFHYFTDGGFEKNVEINVRVGRCTPIGLDFITSLTFSLLNAILLPATI